MQNSSLPSWRELCPLCELRDSISEYSLDPTYLRANYIPLDHGDTHSQSLFSNLLWGSELILEVRILHLVDLV